MKKKIICTLLSVMMTASLLIGCASSMDMVETESIEEDLPGFGKKVGLSMPTQISERWINDCVNMKTQLEELGYTVLDQFAEDDIDQQITQIESFIEKKVDCLVIAAVDSTALVEVEAKAKEAGIPIIAYDRLLMDTDSVSYYASFDNKAIGKAVAESIVKYANLDIARAKGEYLTIELFMGSPDDNNVYLVYEGLMGVLKPYFDDGTLVCKSGNVSLEDTCILRWDTAVAEQRCEEYLATYYTEEDLDICIAGFDGYSYACKRALENAGYTKENWPIITGQDAELQACRNILDGTQTFSVFKDTRVLAKKCVKMVNAVCSGTEPEINDTKQYNNNVMVVPSYLCKPIIVDENNLEREILDTGYYTREQLDAK